MKLFQLLPEKIVHLTCNWPSEGGALSRLIGDFLQFLRGACSVLRRPRSLS